jgi:hypothetical protein
MADLHVVEEAPKAELVKAPVKQGVPARSTGPTRRSSAPDNGQDVLGQLNTLFAAHAKMAYQLPWEILDYVELLAVYNADFSQAVDNLRTLANPGHSLIVLANSARKAEKIKTRLEEKARTIQVSNGGLDGLVDQFFDSAATYGAFCGEWILDESLTDVVDFQIINPKLIRFFWDKEADAWAAYQKVNITQAQEAKKRGQDVKNLVYVKLNSETFYYYAFDNAPGNPYGVPPFTGALVNIAIQRDMLANMSQIVKKLGLLGIIDGVIKSLQKQASETPEQFVARANAYLDQYVAAVDQMTREGAVVHFDDSEFKTFTITGNAAGATNLFKQNEELLISGLKSQPAIQGRSYSVTETYAGVAYDIIIRNTVKYQRAVKRMVEAGYHLMLQVWGLEGIVEKVQIKWNSNKTLNRLQDAQSELLEIKNSLMLWAAGIIDQQIMAQRHGYHTPKTEFDEPPPSGLLGNGSPGGGAGTTSTETDDGENDGNDEPKNDGSKTKSIIDDDAVNIMKANVIQRALNMNKIIEEVKEAIEEESNNGTR